MRGFDRKANMTEEVLDDPDSVEYFNGPIKYYWPNEPFEVDGIVYDPDVRGSVKRSMIDLLPDNGG